MNSYHIIYNVNGETRTATITERSEVAARKNFKSVYTGEGYSITGIELISTSALATKQQERDTLATIRQMVEELGPDSYLATAFAGCFEDAESNIENDFGDSMKARFEKAEEDAQYFRQAASSFSNDLEVAQTEIERLKARYNAFTLRLPTPDDLKDFIALARDRVSEHDQQMTEAAARIVEFAGEPTSTEFQQAVTDHKSAKNVSEYYKALQKRLSNIIIIRD